jgi:hypothetical protein
VIAQEILTIAYGLLHDDVDRVTPRWSDVEFIRQLGSGLDYLWDHRRSAFNTAGIVTAMPAKPTVAGSTVYVQDSYRQPLAHYLTWACLVEDTDDEKNVKLAQYHWDEFEKMAGLTT